MMKQIIFILMHFVFTSNAFSENVELSSSSRYNIRFEPLRLVVNNFSINVLDIKVGNNWTVGPELGYLKYSVSSAGNSSSKIYIDTSFIGIRTNWFKNGVYADGLYVAPFAPFARFAKTDITVPSGSTIEGKASSSVVGCLVGYGWFWNSFNMMLGISPVIASNWSPVVVTDQTGFNTNHLSDRFADAAGEYTLGWTF